MTILHVFTDSPFFESASRFFDSLEGVSNLYYYYAGDKNYLFRKIRSVEKIKVYYSYKDYVANFSRKDVDIVYFHSIHFRFYKFFKYIDKNKIVIWWCFGVEIYGNGITNKSILPLNLYKPLTKSYMDEHPTLRERLVRLFQMTLGRYYNIQRRKAIERVDYFSPVLPQDYYMMKKWCPYLHARPFMLQRGPESPLTWDFRYTSTAGNILVGHSLTYTTNLLDVLSEFKRVKVGQERKIIVPISYGKDYGGIDNVKRLVGDDRVTWLDKYLPLAEYTALFNSITHAVFGMIRQQATGNIDLCLCSGIKIFLYKDSVVYQYLKDTGFYVYSIEDDLSSESLRAPLSLEEAQHNYNLIREIMDGIKGVAQKELNDIIVRKKNICASADLC